MICPSCGGEYADWAQKCPYCNSVNEYADEQLYMAHLEEVRRRLDQVDEEAEASYQRSIRKPVKKVFLIILLLTIASVFIFFSLVRLFQKLSRQSEDHMIAEQIWGQENFDRLEDLYEKGEYDTILNEYYDEILKDDSSQNFYNWKHYGFICRVYMYFQPLEIYYQTVAASDKMDESILGFALWGALSLKYDLTEDYFAQAKSLYQDGYPGGLSPEETERAKEYQQKAQLFLSDTLGFTSEEEDKVYQECKEHDHVSISKCTEYARKHLL